MPQSDTMIALYGVSGHHLTSETSIVACRGADGTWTVDEQGEQSSGLVRILPEPLPGSVVTLSIVNAKRLDRLLSEERTFRDNSEIRGGLSIDGTSWTMMIIKPDREKVVSWSGHLVGRLGKIADLVAAPVN
jgi:hypothetical protein